jgi:C-terminal processing protease CtpA/Prc
MSTPKRSALPLLVVGSGLLAVWGGAMLRNNREVGNAPYGKLPDHTQLLAANESQPIDPELPTGYFENVVEILQKQYVEEIKDKGKLASGAVKGMLSSLEDPLASYLNKEQLSSWGNAQRGVFEGIGVEVKFDYNAEAMKKLKALREKEKEESPSEDTLDAADLIPNLVVTAVAPGSSAEKAGLKPGAILTKVGDKTVLSTDMVETLRKKTEQIRTSKIADEEMDKQLRIVSESYSASIPPVKAKDIVTVGKSGELTLSWKVGPAVSSGTLVKGEWKWPSVRESSDGSIQLVVVEGAADALGEKLEKFASKPVTLDFRNSTQGNFSELQKLIDLLLPAGPVGKVASDKGTEVAVLKSAGKGVKVGPITLLVDQSTRGAAEVLANLLRNAGLGVLQGVPAGEDQWMKTVALPDGSGYTLPTGRVVALDGGRIARTVEGNKR